MADQLISGTTLIEDKRTTEGEIWSCSGSNFHGSNPDVDDLDVDSTNGQMRDVGGGNSLLAPVNLPHGVTITAVVVYGDAGSEDVTFTLFRNDHFGSNSDTIGSAFVNTEDRSLSNDKVDNLNYSYNIRLNATAANDDIYGARIIYSI